MKYGDNKNTIVCSVIGLGLFSEIRGLRSDVMVCDDIMVDERTKAEYQ